MNGRKGKHLYLYNIDQKQDDEETKTGLTGTWSFTEDDKLSQELVEITFRMSEGKDTDNDGKRLNDIIKIVEQDISDILGYQVTISDNCLFYIDNDTEPGKWFKIVT